MENIIVLEDVKKEYGTSVKTQVLKGVNVSFAPGTFNAIIGQSGSGKSTLLNLIGTLDTPSSGTITIKGNHTKAMKAKALAKLRNETIGFIFQFHYLLPEFSALENVLIPYEIQHGKRDHAAVQRANELMDLVGLSKVKQNKANNMSGGQQQRVAIARALMNQPEIILADEPTGNLDSISTEQIYELMREINRKFNTTFIIITHDRRVAEKADRIVEISDGEIVMDVVK
ncbi:MAG: ABC transporter ATP-binding protein [Erysipelotrichaceae bacterium]